MRTGIYKTKLQKTMFREVALPGSVYIASAITLTMRQNCFSVIIDGGMDTGPILESAPYSYFGYRSYEDFRAGIHPACGTLLAQVLDRFDRVRHSEFERMFKIQDSMKSKYWSRIDDETLTRVKEKFRLGFE